MDLVFDILVDFLFELFMEGSIEASMSRKVPLFLRILLLGAVVAVYGFLLYVVICIAIEHKSPVVWGIAFFILLIFILAFRKKWKERVNKD